MTFRTQMIIALLIRVLLLLLSSGGFAQIYYADFLESFSFSFDPWTDWIKFGGREDAFPYGLVLFVLFLFVQGLSSALNLLVGVDSFVVTYALMLILCDALIAKILRNNSGSKASSVYLLSPLVLYINFIYLQTDALIGLFILVASVLFAKRRSKTAGIFLGLAIGSKFGVIIVLPFLAIFAALNRRLRSKILEFVAWSFGVAFFAYTPAIWSKGFRDMVFGTSEISNLIEISLDMGSRDFYLFPAVYVVFCVWIYRNFRSGLYSVVGFVGCGLFSLALFSESAVGWFLWGISSMVYVGVFTRIGAGAIFYILQIFVILRDITSGNLSEFGYQINGSSSLISNGFFTLTIALGSLWTLSILRETTKRSDSLKLNEKPLVIVIAGDSGVGKDTLVESITGLLGQESVTVIPGDGYHKHERGHLKWKVHTHLNPLENDLEDWGQDLKRAISREDLYIRNYDHSNGRFEYSDGVKPRDLIISQGLHALYGKASEEADLKVFLEMQEESRFNLKLARDTTSRNHTKNKSINEIERRKKDYKQYVQNQRARADLIIRQESSKIETTTIDTLFVETKIHSLADFLYNNCSPLIGSIEYPKRENELQQLVFRFADLVDSKSLDGVLTRGFSQVDDYFPKEKIPSQGSIGLVAVLTLLSVFYMRGFEN